MKTVEIYKTRKDDLVEKTTMTTENKIISRRELAIRLSNGSVNIELLSKKVEKTVNLWLNRKEVVIENGFLKLA